MNVWNIPEHAVWVYGAFWRIEIDCGTYRSMQFGCMEHIEIFNICLPTRLKYTNFDSLAHTCEVLRAVDLCACEHCVCVSLDCVCAELPSYVVARLYWQHLLLTFEFRWRQNNLCQFCVNGSTSVLACIKRRKVWSVLLSGGRSFSSKVPILILIFLVLFVLRHHLSVFSSACSHGCRLVPFLNDSCLTCLRLFLMTDVTTQPQCYNSCYGALRTGLFRRYTKLLLCTATARCVSPLAK